MSKEEKSFVEVSNPDEKKKEDFMRKHGPVDVAKTIREKEKAKEQYSQDVSELEENIKTFTGRLEPLLDPVSGKPLCWVRNPTQKEFENLVPQEFWKYKENPEGIPEEIAKKYADHQFDMMAFLIEKPKHDAAWWKEHANLPFQMLFQEHIMKVYEDLGIKVGNF